jgi:hypothetical protein
MPAGPTYEPIATTTLGSTASSVTFSSLGAYTDIVAIVSSKVTSSAWDLGFRVNGDSGTNYSRTFVGSSGSVADSGRATNVTYGRASYRSYMGTTDFGAYILNFQNYSNSTTYKTVLCRGNAAATGTDAQVVLWRNTAAITSIELSPEFSGTFAVGSTFTIYGIKSA